MAGIQADLFSSAGELDLVRFLLADMHDDLKGKVARFKYLSDISMSLGSDGTMLTGGEVTYAAWTEARTSFINGNFIATVMLCQGLAEHLLASTLDDGLNTEALPKKIAFRDTLKRCKMQGIISEVDVADLSRLSDLRNPLAHYRNIDDPSNLSRRAIEAHAPAALHLIKDANFAISMAVRLLALPAFRLGD